MSRPITTLADLGKHDTALATCGNCGHLGVVLPAYVPVRMTGVRISELARYLRCRMCGRKSAETVVRIGRR